MRGVTSEGMVLCATSTDGLTVEFVDPPANSVAGNSLFQLFHYFNYFNDIN